MSTNQSRYKKLVKAYHAAFSDIKKQTQYQQARNEWKQMKDSSKEYEKLMVSLRVKAEKQKSSQLQWWVQQHPQKLLHACFFLLTLSTSFSLSVDRISRISVLIPEHEKTLRTFSSVAFYNTNFEGVYDKLY